MSNLLNLTAGVLSAMRSRRMFRTDGFTLHAGFVGEYKPTKVEATASKVGESEDNFRLHCTSATGAHSLPGFMVSNAFIVPKEVVMPTEFIKVDRPHAWYFEQVSEVIRQSTRLHQQFGDNEFAFPEKFEVLGAYVQKDSAGEHPYIPLKRYPFYSTILSHHKKLHPDATFVDRDTIAMYLAEKGEARPAVPADYKLQLRNHGTEVWEYRNWNPTLFIRDWR